MKIGNFFEEYENNKILDIVGPFFDIRKQNFGDPVIFVDGGANFRCDGSGFSIGDNDSFKGQLDQQLPKDKDLSDLAFVLNHVPETFEEINLKGFLGGRKDHEIMNFAEVHRFLATRKYSCKLAFDQSPIAYSAGEWKIEIEGIFSIFSFSSEVKLKLEGDCLYRLNGEEGFLGLSSNGLSNQAFGQVELTMDAPLFLFLCI